MTAFTDALERALHCRDNGDDVGLLAALLEAWQIVPDDALAGGIDEVSLRIERSTTRGFDPLGRNLKRKTWHEVASRGRPEDLAWLLGVLASVDWAIARDLEPFTRARPDPRIARALPGLRRQFPDDPEVIEALSRHRRAPAPIPAEARDLHARVARPILEAQALERALLERVWENPDDDAPRLVYADWLLERENPRGEFITLQFAARRGELPKPQRERMSRLARRFQDDWLGGIAGAMLGASFERGFLDSAILRVGPADLAPAIGRPEWATARLLNYPSRDGPQVFVDLVTHPVMHDLREIHGLVDASFVALAAHPRATPLETLGFIMSMLPTFREREMLAAGEAFPRVRALAIGGARHALDWLPGSALAARLERLSVVCTAAEAIFWLRDLAEGRLPRLHELDLSLHDAGKLMVRDQALHALRIAPALLVRILDALAPKTFREVRCEPRPQNPAWPQLQAAALLQGGLVDT